MIQDIVASLMLIPLGAMFLYSCTKFEVTSAGQAALGTGCCLAVILIAIWT